MDGAGGRAGWGRWLAGGIALAGFAACLVAGYPGHFTPDSVWQLAQGREGRFNDWHPPAMAWLLGLADRLSAGAGPFMAFDAALFYGGLFGLAALSPRPRPAGLALLALCMVSPVAVIFQGAVLKDVLFANSALAGFAALAWAGRVVDRPALRRLLLALAVMLFALAALTRQNGLVAAVIAGMAWGALIWRGRRPARALAGGAAVLTLVLVVAGAASLALRVHAIGPPESPHHLKILQTWDLAGATRLDPGLALPALRADAPAVEGFIRHEAAPAWRAAGADNIVTLPGGAVLTNPSGPAVGRDWMRMATTRPGLYLAVRARVFLDTLLTPADARCPMIFVGVDGGSPAMLRRAGLAPRDDDRDDWDGDYAATALGTPLFSHAAYAAAILALLGLSGWRWRRGARDEGLIVGAALGLAGLAFAASFFVLSVDCDYRFLYFLDVAAMGMAVTLACGRGPRETRSRC